MVNHFHFILYKGIRLPFLETPTLLSKKERVGYFQLNSDGGRN